MNPSIKRLTAVAGLLCLFAGIAWAKMYTDFDPSADFSSYATYAWIEPKAADQSELPDYLRRRLRRVTEDVLATKGLEPSLAPPQTDLLLTYHFSINRDVVIDYVPYSLYQPFGYSYWPGYTYTYTQVRSYAKGTVVLDIVDARTHQLVWVGTVEKEIQSANPPGKKIEKTVAKLLKNFPPS